MLLPREEVELFYRLHCALMQFVQEQLRTAGILESAAAYSALSPEKRHEVAQAFLGRLDLIDAFIAANPARLSEEELGIVSSWRHLVAGRFIALRQLKKHMILLACDESSMAYGVTGLIDPMELVIPRPLPAMIETVLLPFLGKIVHHGIVNGFNVTFGPGSRRGFEESFRTAKANRLMVTSLPATATPGHAVGDSRKPRLIKAPQPPGTDARQILKQVAAMTDEFCQTFLNEEYAALCRKLAEKLAARRPSPLPRGKPETWACGIIRTIGWVNFLDDRSQSPHMKLPVIDRASVLRRAPAKEKPRRFATC